MSDLISKTEALIKIRGCYPSLPIFKKNRKAWQEKYEGYIKAYEIIKDLPTAEPKTGEWIPCSERLPEIDNVNEINEFDVLLAVRPKKHPERTPQVYIGKLCPVEGDDGSGNFWGVKTAPCEWTIWGWSYFQEPEVLAWMPLPKPWKGE